MSTRQTDKDGRVTITLTEEEWGTMTSNLFNGGDSPVDENRRDNVLLRSIKDNLTALKELQEEAGGEWGSVDLFYRFYHQSFKVYRIQGYTTCIRKMFMEVGLAVTESDKECGLDSYYNEICAEGTGIEFDTDHNREWTRHTRPIMEAYFHSKMFLDLMIKCGEGMESASNSLPSGWAAVLCLYNMR